LGEFWSGGLIWVKGLGGTYFPKFWRGDESFFISAIPAHAQMGGRSPSYLSSVGLSAFSTVTAAGHAGYAWNAGNRK
jgi:hypothetical protein